MRGDSTININRTFNSGSIKVLDNSSPNSPTSTVMASSVVSSEQDTSSISPALSLSALPYSHQKVRSSVAA